LRLNFHGILREKYGDSFVMQARSIREAVEGFSRQAADWPRDLRIVIPGLDTPEALDSCPDEIDLMPAMQGGSGKFGAILLGAALIGASFLLPGSGAFLGVAMGSLHASLIISGALMMLQGVIGLFMKAPTFKTSQDPEASKYVSVNRNTTAVGTPVTIAYGRIQLGGQWLSLQSDSNNLSHGEFPATPT
jgi:predicted phage tail protein